MMMRMMRIMIMMFTIVERVNLLIEKLKKVCIVNKNTIKTLVNKI
jgi:hypothetical protein